MQARACTGWTGTMPAPAAKPPTAWPGFLHQPRLPSPQPCRPMWTWWATSTRARRCACTPAHPSSPSACCAATTSSSCLSCTPPTCARWPATWPSWRQAARWRCCTKTALRASRSFCLHRPGAPWCCAIPAMKSRATTPRCSTWRPIRSSVLPRAPMRSGTPSSRAPKPTTCPAA